MEWPHPAYSLLSCSATSGRELAEMLGSMQLAASGLEGGSGNLKTLLLHVEFHLARSATGDVARNCLMIPTL